MVDLIVSGGDAVRLTGELPDGYPTETYLNGELIDRDFEGDFGWDMEKRVPALVSDQDDMSCADLVVERDFWISGDADNSTAEDSTLRQLAYAQNAINLHAERGC